MTLSSALATVVKLWKALCADLVDRALFAIFRAEAVFGAHAGEHGVVDVDAFGFHVHDLPGLEAAVGAGDGVEDAGELTLHIGVAPVAGLGGNRNHGVFQDGAAIGFPRLVEAFEEVGDFVQLHVRVGAQLLVGVLLLELVPPLVTAAF